MKRLTPQFEFSMESGEISGPGGRETLEPQAMAVLGCLAAEPGKLWSRDELLARAWPGKVVSDATLSAVVSRLRKRLRAVGVTDVTIDTRSRRGYILRVEMSQAGEATHRSTFSGRVAVITFVFAAAVGALVHTSGLAPWTAGSEKNFIRLTFDISSPMEASISPVLIVENGGEGEIRVFEKDPLMVRVQALREADQTVLLKFELGGFSHWGRFEQRVALGEHSLLEMQASSREAKFRIGYMAEAVSHP